VLPHVLAGTTAGLVADPERITTEIMTYYRALDEGATLRHYLRHADEEGGPWYIEAVSDRGGLIAVERQS
jgi:hypothetical protein